MTAVTHDHESPGGRRSDRHPVPAAEEVSSGRRLPSSTAAYFGARYGHDFSTVRVHTDARSGADARHLHAQAFTVGSDIHFAPGRYEPDTAGGQRLLAHELAHVVQQRGRSPTGTTPDRTGERAADDAAAQALSGGSARVAAVRSTGPQLQDEAAARSADSLGGWQDTAIDIIAGAVAGDGLTKRLAVAVLRGFLVELRTQIVDLEGAERARKRLAELKNPMAVAEVAGGYLAGLVGGVVSPVTDLVGLLGLADVVPKLVAQLGGNAVGVAAKLAELEPELMSLGTEAKAAIAELLRDPAALVELVAGLEATVVTKAGELGHDAARSMVKIFEAPFGQEPQVESAPTPVLASTADFLTSPAAAVLGTAGRGFTRATEKLKGALISTPWRKVGYEVGHVVGAVVVNVAMLVLSDGIGNLVAKASEALGRLAPALRGLASAAGKIGEAIAALERVIGAVVGSVVGRIKPLGKVLGPFERLMTRLRNLLRELLGIAEKEAAPVVSAVEKKVAAKITGGGPPPPVTSPPVTPPPAPKSVPPPRPGLRGWTAEGYPADQFTHGPLPEVPANIPVSRSNKPLMSQDEYLESYADAMRPKTRSGGPASAAARERGGGPYIRENLFAKEGAAVSELQSKGILRATEDTVHVLDPDAYVEWLGDAYRFRGNAHLDPRTAEAVKAYVGSASPLPSAKIGGGGAPSSFGGSLPGTHAEILAVNDVLVQGAKGPVAVATLRARFGGHFAACMHCSAILTRLAGASPELRVLTGLVSP